MIRYWDELKDHKVIPLLVGVIIAFIGFLFFAYIENKKVLLIGLIFIVIGVIIGFYGLIKFGIEFSKRINK